MGENQKEDKSLPEQLVDTALAHAGHALAGIPAPVSKNLFTALNRLCTAAVDIPVAHLEGITSEKRAETAARVKIIDTGADQISKQMEMDPEFARAAVYKYGQRIVRGQANLNRICEVAANQIAQDADDHPKTEDTEETAADINEDWLNAFEREASEKSTEEMQNLFGRILAGEIQRPSSFSLRTIKLIGQLDSSTASIFRRFCSLAIYMGNGSDILGARVCSIGGNAGNNVLVPYGLTFDDLTTLNEHGLIIPEFNVYMDYRNCLFNENGNSGALMWHQGKPWILKMSQKVYTLMN